MGWGTVLFVGWLIVAATVVIVTLGRNSDKDYEQD